MEQKGKRLCNLNHLSTNIHCKKLHLQSPSCIEDTQSCSLVTFDVHADASYRSVPLSGSDWFADMGLVQTVQWNQKIEALLSCCLAWSSLNWLQSVSVHSVCRDYWQCCCCHCLRTRSPSCLLVDPVTGYCCWDVLEVGQAGFPHLYSSVFASWPSSFFNSPLT